MEETKKDFVEIDILDILIILAKHKKFIIITTFIVSLAAVIYSLVTPEYWKSTASLLPTQEESGGLGALASSVMGMDVGGMLGMGGASSSAINNISIMKSRTFSEKVIREFDLVEYLEMGSDWEEDSLLTMDAIILELSENIVGIGLDDESGIVNISAITKNKALSRDIANYYWIELDKYNRKFRKSKGRESRLFIENRLREVEQELASLEMEMRDFQRNTNTLMIEEQTREIISAYAGLIRQKTEAEIQFGVLSHYMDINNSELGKYKNLIKEVDKKIGQMEASSDILTPSYLLAMDSIPDLGMQYARLFRDIQVQQAIFQFLYPQYEQAKIEEVKDLPTIEVLDKGRLAGRRERPRRAMICILAFIIAVISSSTVAVVREYLGKVAQSSKYNSRINDLKRNIF